eukprot:2246933-Alexandrium_andersonii.AAC.1
MLRTSANSVLAFWRHFGSRGNTHTSQLPLLCMALGHRQWVPRGARQRRGQSKRIGTRYALHECNWQRTPPTTSRGQALEEVMDGVLRAAPHLAARLHGRLQ